MNPTNSPASTTTTRILNNTPPPSPTEEENWTEEIQDNSVISELHDRVGRLDVEASNLENGEIHFINNIGMNMSNEENNDDDQSSVAQGTFLFGEENSRHIGDENELDNSNALDEQDDSDNWSIIRINNSNAGSRNADFDPPAFNFDRWAWGGSNEQESDEHDRRRHQSALREVEQIQRSNFVHFLLLCMVPTSLLLILVVSVMGNESNNACSTGNSQHCYSEARSFFNPFTSRCICEAVML